jgi:hypothetical protein
MQLAPNVFFQKIYLVVMKNLATTSLFVCLQFYVHLGPKSPLD